MAAASSNNQSNLPSGINIASLAPSPMPSPSAPSDPTHFLFTSECVCEGHPDKLCDQLSDAILDACLAQDPKSKVACNCSAKTALVMVYGEITTKAVVNFESVVRSKIQEIGYDSPAKGLDYKTCNCIIAVEKQSPDIAQAVHQNKRIEEIGAGDQGMMFGYASDETPEMMPLTLILASKICARLAEVRRNGIMPYLRPDGKSQVTVEYARKADGSIVPIRVHTLVISAQHDEVVQYPQLKADLLQHVIQAVVPAKYIDSSTIFHLNPSKRFVIGGPTGDSGLTGRKIIVDTYGGWGAHGGGAFSGKDCTKVDRSGAYIARQIAKSIVHSQLAKRVLVQLSYAIGVVEPLAIFVDTYGTGTVPDAKFVELIRANFDMRPGCIIRDLQLDRPKFAKTACYGHFGRSDPDFTWEVPKTLTIPK